MRCHHRHAARRGLAAQESSRRAELRSNQPSRCVCYHDFSQRSTERLPNDGRWWIENATRAGRNLKQGG